MLSSRVTLDIHDFLKQRQHLPVVDVRSQGEFGSGHIAGAHNIPILNDEERKAVGTDYKQKGQLEAIRTGFKLVGPRLSSIIETTEHVAGEGGELLVHCWRGGMRSFNFCQFVEMAQLKTHQLRGGYKAYRQLAMESFGKPLHLIVIGGATGSGKSDVLRALERQGEQTLDLEALASHKGSVFGGLMMPQQPTTEQFQNNLFEDILKIDATRRIWIEDESIAVGKVFLPNDFWQQLRSGPIVELVVDKDKRIERLVAEYGPADRDAFGEAMGKIAKKLGGQHYKSARQALEANDMTTAISTLLTYYDKAYGHGLTNRNKQIILRHEYDGEHVDTLAKDLINTVAIHGH